MLRFLWVISALLLLSAACGGGSTQSGCLEDVEPRQGCVDFAAVNRTCEAFLVQIGFEFRRVDFEETCECQLLAVADDYPACEEAWDAENTCIGTLDCEELIALLTGDPSARCRDAIDETNEVCVDEDGRPLPITN